MKNTRKVFGKWTVVIPENVIKIGLVCDTYKMKFIEKLWGEAEIQAKFRMPTFNRKDYFYEEQLYDEEKKLTFCFRFYTPESNRVLTKDTMT